MAERAFDITLDPALAYRIAELAREFATEGDTPDVSDPDLESDSGDEPILDVEHMLEEDRDVAVDPIENELRSMIDGLNIDAQKDLLALIWLGRDGGSDKDFHSIRRQATETSNLHVAQYVEETPLVSDYLIEGLLALGYDE